MHLRRIAVSTCLAAALVSLQLPATALGASAVFRAAAGDELVFLAQVTRSNQVTIARAPGSFLVTDAGDTVGAGTACVMESPNGARCDATGIARIRVVLEDGDDRAALDVDLPTIVRAGDGNDTVDGGSSSDVLEGGAGVDTLSGGDGNDQLSGEDNVSVCQGLGGNVLRGGAGDDELRGGDGGDDMGGGEGGDLLEGCAGADLLAGDAGVDRLIGDDGDDTLSGGEGDDMLGTSDAIGIPPRSREYGSDTVNGDAGDDRLFAGDGPALGVADADLLNGGSGSDTVAYDKRTTAVVASIDGQADDGAFGEQDAIQPDVEILLGGEGPDTLRGSPGDDRIDGRGGEDTIDGLAGGDVLLGGAGDAADDDIAGGDGPDELDGGPGGDELTAGDGADSVDGGAGGDRLEGAAGVDELAGGEGRDTLDGGPQGDLLLGGGGDDLAVYPDGAPTTVSLDGVRNDGRNDGRERDDVQVEDVTGGRQDDTFIGDASRNELAGGTGEDYIDGGERRDQLSAGARSDVVRARDGVREPVSCGPGDDFAIADRGDAVVTSGRNACERVDTAQRITPAAAEEARVTPRGCGRRDELRMQLPAMARAVPLRDRLLLHVGTSIDAEDCGVDLQTRARDGTLLEAHAAGAQFRVEQRRSTSDRTRLRLHPIGCPPSDGGAHVARHNDPPLTMRVRFSSRRRGKARASASATRGAAGAATVVVVGRASVATASGAADWVTTERCSGTRTRVRRGNVTVRIAGTGRRVVVVAGEQFTARRGRG